jgi:PAS domain S-box-containing protein
MLGYERDEMLGQSARMIYPSDEEFHYVGREKYRQIAEQGIGTVETRFRCKDGSIIDVLLSSAPIEPGDLSAGVTFTVLDITDRKKAEEALRQMNDTLEEQVAARTAELERSNQEIRELSHMTIRAMENDRRALAKELHDSIGGTLAAIKYQLEARVETTGSTHSPHELPLEKIIDYIGHTIQESRRITKQLRPSVLDDFGLIAAVEEHIGDFQGFNPHIKVLKQIHIDETDLSGDAKTVLYRVLQEALNNVAKHSKADRVNVRCYRDGGRVKLQIRDNGVGFDPDEVLGCANIMDGYGLHSMTERVEICKGEFHIESAPAKGATLVASIPVDMARYDH